MKRIYVIEDDFSVQNIAKIMDLTDERYYGSSTPVYKKVSITIFMTNCNYSQDVKNIVRFVARRFKTEEILRVSVVYERAFGSRRRMAIAVSPDKGIFDEDITSAIQDRVL
jgi:hypothetical protein